MCGRFSLTASPEEVANFFELSNLEAFPPRYNIAPTQPILMVVPDPRQGILVRWGLMPHWVKDPGEFTLLVNARSETAAEKPSFRTAMRHRRTLIPASGFYEWHRPKDGAKQAYWIKPKDGGIVAFGGMMETWTGANGSEIDTGCVLTTPSNAAIAKVHHRMPVVIKPENFEEWLDCKTQEPRNVAHLMQAVDEDFFEIIPVSDRVNKVANSDPSVQEAAELNINTGGRNSGSKNENSNDIDLESLDFEGPDLQNKKNKIDTRAAHDEHEQLKLF